MCAFLQSLDYDNSENQLFLEEERRINHTVSLRWVSSPCTLFSAALVLPPGLGAAPSHPLWGPPASDPGLCPGARDA